MVPNLPPVAGFRPSGPDDLDRLLSGFFREQVPRPWPAAPAADIEPSSLVAAREAVAVADGSRSRWTLAASVAVLGGICWYASQGTPTGAPAITENVSGAAVAEETSILPEMERHRTVPASLPTKK